MLVVAACLLARQPAGPQTASLHTPALPASASVAEAIKDDERRAETRERERREALQVPALASCHPSSAACHPAHAAVLWAHHLDLQPIPTSVTPLHPPAPKQERDDARKRARQERLNELRSGGRKVAQALPAPAAAAS